MYAHTVQLPAIHIPDGAAKLSDYPAAKILVSCSHCGITGQFDKAAMLRAGGDRALTHLLDDIRKRKGCPRPDERASLYEKCQLVYSNVRAG